MGQSKLIVAFDPGGTTGYATRALDRRTTGSSYDYDSTWGGGQLGPGKHHKELWSLLTSICPDRIICEDFVYQIRQNRGVDQPGIKLIARDYIGVLELYSQLTKKPLIYQQPAVLAVSWASDASLKQLGILKEPKTTWRHQNDASRHLLYYAVTELDRRDLLSPLRKPNVTNL